MPTTTPARSQRVDPTAHFLFLLLWTASLVGAAPAAHGSIVAEITEEPDGVRWTVVEGGSTHFFTGMEPTDEVIRAGDRLHEDPGRGRIEIAARPCCEITNEYRAPGVDATDYRPISREGFSADQISSSGWAGGDFIEGPLVFTKDGDIFYDGNGNPIGFDTGGTALFEGSFGAHGIIPGVESTVRFLNAEGEEEFSITTRTVATASLTIVKESSPADGTDFSFTSGLADAADPAAFTLDDADPDDGDSRTDTRTFDGIIAGTYEITEDLPDGWFVEADCTGGSDPGTLDGATLTVEVGAREDVVCTFRNTEAATIEIVQDSVPDSPQDFSFSGGLGEFTLDDDDDSTLGETKSFSVPPDTYAVTQAPVTGYELTSITCSDGDSTGNPDTGTATIEAAAGETLTCTFETSASSTDVAIDKAATEDPGDPSILVFALTAINRGPAPTTGLIVDDDLPAGLVYLSDDCGAAISGDPADGELVAWSIGSLPAGEQDTCTVSVGRETGESITNEAGFTMDQTDTDPSNDVGSATIADVAPTVAVTKTSATTEVAETGETVTYTFTVENTGDVAFEITALDDDRFGPLTGATGCQTGTELDLAESCSFDAAFDVPAGTTGEDFVNTFTAEVTNADGTTGTADDSHTVAYTDVAPTLALTKTSTTTQVPETGETVTYTFTVENTGEVDFTIDALDDDQFGALSGNDGCKTGTELTPDTDCSFDANLDVPAGTSGEDFVNTFTAEVIDADGTTASANDQHSLTYLAQTMSIDPSGLVFGKVVVGDSATTTITVTNTGQTEVIIESIIDPDEPFSITGGSCTDVPLPLAPTETCEIVIAFEPDRIGNASSSFAIESNAPSSPDSVALTGTIEPLPVPALNRYGLLLLTLLLCALGWRIARPAAG